MTNDEFLRGVPNLAIGVVLALFAAATIVRGRRRGGHTCWPVPWYKLSAWFLASVGAVALVDGTRLLWWDATAWEHRAAYVALWTAVVASVWLFWRWARDGEDDLR